MQTFIIIALCLIALVVCIAAFSLFLPVALLIAFFAFVCWLAKGLRGHKPGSAPK